MDKPQLRVAISSLKRIAPPSFECTAICCCDLEEESYFERVINKEIFGVAFTGSYSGAIARWNLAKDSIEFMGYIFGHNSKVVSIQQCHYPIIFKAVCSLSIDGTIAVWSLNDSICANRFDKLLPYGCQNMAISGINHEIAVISGSFQSIYIINIQTGQIIRQRRIHNMILNISIYTYEDEEWFIHTSCNGGIAANTLSTVDDTSRTIVFNDDIVFDPSRYIVQACPSPSHSFMLFVLNKGYSLVSLTIPGHLYYIDEDIDVYKAIWLGENSFCLINFDGTTLHYECKNPAPERKFIQTINPSNFDSKRPVIKPPELFAPLSNLVSKKPPPSIARIQRRSMDMTPPPDPKDVVVEKPKLLRTKTASGIYLPQVSRYKGGIVLGVGNHIIIESMDFKESNIESQYTEESIITSNTYVIEDDSIVGVVEGTANGTIHYRKLMVTGNEEAETDIQIKHNGKVTALLATEGLLFTAGTDSIVNIIALEDFHLVNSCCHLMTPIIYFSRVPSLTRTIADEMVFGVSRDNQITVFSVVTGEVLFIFSGHDGIIENLFLHPFTGLVIVECRSLYFWSLKTGNLESQLTGHHMQKFIKESSSFLLSLKPSSIKLSSIEVKAVDFGSMFLYVLIVNPMTFSSDISRTLKENCDIPISEALHKVKNLPIMLDLMSQKMQEHLKKYVPEFVSNFYMSTVGNGGVISFWAPRRNYGSKVVWQVSPILSAIAFSLRIYMYFGLHNHPALLKDLLSEYKVDIIEMMKDVPDFKFPSISHVLSFLMGSGSEIYSYIIDELAKYSPEMRKQWLQRLDEAFMVFPYMRSIYGVTYSTIATTLISEIKDHNKVRSAINTIVSLQLNSSTHDFAAELMTRGINEFIQHVDDPKSLYKMFAETAGPLQVGIKNQLLITCCKIDHKNYLDAIKDFFSAARLKPAAILIQALLNVLYMGSLDNNGIAMSAKTLLEVPKCLPGKSPDECAAMFTVIHWLQISFLKEIIIYGTNDGTMMFITRKNGDMSIHSEKVTTSSCSRVDVDGSFGFISFTTNTNDVFIYRTTKMATLGALTKRTRSTSFNHAGTLNFKPKISPVMKVFEHHYEKEPRVEFKKAKHVTLLFHDGTSKQIHL